MYVRKNYKLDYRASGKGELRQRWNGLAHHIAYFIQTSTDVAVITLFMDIKYVSVYSVYYAIVSGVGKIIISVANGSAAGLGNLIALGEKKAINRVVDVFEFVQSSITTVIYVITAMMLLPFIKLYTKGINDVNYADALFGYLLIIAYAIYSVRYIYSTVTLNANRYKETQAGAIAECTSNIIISVLLIKPLGLAGVALGTAVSMFIRCIFDVVYLSKHVVHRPIYKFFKNILINALAATVAIAVCRMAIDYNVSGWLDWIWKSVLTGAVSAVCAFGVYVLFCKKMVFELFGRLRHLF
ncbi:MAG: polysaccharide biosynthesis protein [Clostridia bacterium]|nr:polysaccharide biosynthesis protein [Clostridia bacterium]